MNTLHTVLTKAHSGWRWIVLILLILIIVKALQGRTGNRQYTEGTRKLALFTMIAFHIQFLVGIVLLFISPKVQFSGEMMSNSLLRFFTMEHSVMMLLAFILITIGHSKSKKASTDIAKFKAISLFYSIAFVIIMFAIPWPFRGFGAGWY